MQGVRFMCPGMCVCCSSQGKTPPNHSVETVLALSICLSSSFHQCHSCRLHDQSLLTLYR
ncbi:hypothetical protein BDQ94DRAFT_132927 [Aspergillus welwitschiae]|uniref:Uncharacterized protein n=1 Tax=Aspergillus welwitschiae TaxID=1341132 RepID=A0A3F3QJA5_9EURO|nr:hypothetical protein BDQ94DRAFT_132927 [Aspergillus welwitschiae]RDH39353.1 hypothetical protein BDQ94DRAFT_132927 [Aspergillus welwitschiae]